MNDTKRVSRKIDYARTRPRDSVIWLALLGALAVIELVAVITNRAGGALSHTVWWLYGPPLELRWFLVSAVVNGLLMWACVHFMWPPWGWRALLVIVVCLLLVHTAVWLAVRA